MRITIDFQNPLNLPVKGYKKLFKQIARAVMERIDFIYDFEVSITLTDDISIQQLNRQFRQKDRSTDVLSFPQYHFHEGKVPLSMEKGIIIPLGDIVISHPTAKRQARTYRHLLKREISFLFTHGLLHLLGYDHEQLADEKRMFQLQENVLNQLGITREGDKKNG